MQQIITGGCYILTKWTFLITKQLPKSNNKMKIVTKVTAAVTGNMTQLTLNPDFYLH